MKNIKLREKDIEKYLKRRVILWLNGKAYKYTSPSRRSVPDDVVLWIPFGRIHGRSVFVECKAPRKTWTELQARERDRLEDLGQLVFLVDTKESVDDLMIILNWLFL